MLILLQATSQEQAAAVSEGVPLAILPVQSSVPSGVVENGPKSGMLMSGEDGSTRYSRADDWRISRR